MTDQEIARIFKALGDERRIEIIRQLYKGEECACHLLEDLDISQPTLSHHMKILCDTHIVIPRKDGKWTHYSLNKAGIETAQNLLGKITNGMSEDKKSCCSH